MLRCLPWQCCICLQGAASPRPATPWGCCWVGGCSRCRDCLWDTVPERIKRKALQQERSYRARTPEAVAPEQGQGSPGAPRSRPRSPQEQEGLQAATTSGEGSEAEACGPAASQAHERPPTGASPHSGKDPAAPTSRRLNVNARDAGADVPGAGSTIARVEELLPAAAPSAEASGPLSEAVPPGQPLRPDPSAACPSSASWVVLEEGGWQAVWEGSQESVYFGNAALGLTQWEAPTCLAHWDWHAWAETYKRHLVHSQEQEQDLQQQQQTHGHETAAWQQQQVQGQSQQQLASGPWADRLDAREPLDQGWPGNEASFPPAQRAEPPLSEGHPSSTLQGEAYPGPLSWTPGGLAAEGAAGPPPGVPLAYHEQLQRELLQVQAQRRQQGARPAASAAGASAPAAQGRDQDKEPIGWGGKGGGGHRKTGAVSRSSKALAVSPFIEQVPVAGVTAVCASSSHEQGLAGGAFPTEAKQGATPHGHHNLPLAFEQPELPHAQQQQQQDVASVSLSKDGGLAKQALPLRPSQQGEIMQTEGDQAATWHSLHSTPCLTPHCGSCAQSATAVYLVLGALCWSVELACTLGIRVIRWLHPLALRHAGAAAGAAGDRGNLCPSQDLAGAIPESQGHKFVSTGLGKEGDLLGQGQDTAGLRLEREAELPIQGEESASAGLGREGELYRRYAAGMPADMPKEHERYWVQRYSLFANFDAGVRMAPDSWFSVTPQVLAQHHARRCAGGVAVDAFCGVGGNAIQLALRCRHVVAIDLEPAKLRMAAWNLALHQGAPAGARRSVDFLIGDSLQLLPSIQADVVFLSPPWGGPGYLSAKEYDTSTMLLPVSGYQLLQLALASAPRVALFLPRTTRLEHLKHLWVSVAPHLPCEVETAYLNGRVKAITMYIGHFNS